MALNIDKNSIVVFDLDDTLYNEIEYLRSAYSEISTIIEKHINENIFEEMIELYNNGQDVFGTLLSKYKLANLTKEDLINIYRSHVPKIELFDGLLDFLKILKNNHIRLGIITDGRSITQRNKLHALKVSEFIDDIVISEEFGYSKPSKEVYLYFENKYPNRNYYYIGDNFSKDFITPNKLGWVTLAIKDNGFNIHKLNKKLDFEYLPKYQISSYSELLINFN